MILLDTHVWFWWTVSPDELSEAAGEAIAGADTIAVSPLSCYELGILVRRGRAQLDREIADWTRQALAREGILVAEVHPSAALRAAALGPEFPGDPIDRLLYATAVELGARFVTRDERLRAADPVRTLW